MKDALGDRMKEFYEDRFRYYLPRKTYTLLRIDGRSFKNYTKGLKKPFDDDLMDDMDMTALSICNDIDGARFAYVQSDEISILITDFETRDTQAWFDNNLQKMCSISASLATGFFNKLRTLRLGNNAKIANFDSRVFQIPQKIEVENYFIWRQQDCVRNSIQSVAQSLYSPKELHGKSSCDLQEMIFQKGINWNDFEPRYKRGRIIMKKDVQVRDDLTRSKFVVADIPIITQEREFLSNLIPDNK